jgi:hypothetical protein
MPDVTSQRFLPAPRIAGLLPAIVPTRSESPLTIRLAVKRLPSTLHMPFAHAAEALLAEAASYLAGDSSATTLHHAYMAFAETLIALREDVSPIASPAAPQASILSYLPPTPYPSQETLDAALEPLCQRISSQLRLLDALRSLRGGER